MKVKTIPSTWLQRDGRRFDCGPYTSGALEAKIRLEKISAPKQMLGGLTAGGLDGIFHAGRESRAWVDSREYGVPFLSSGAILTSDLSQLPLISKHQIAANPQFTIRNGWTLITRSGTIGRMVYSRPDMDGLACSEHVMRVVPDPKKVPAGYLFAFLSSKFGVPLVTSGTYGSIIQSIEPRHIADLPVPRLCADIEGRAHTLVDGAAKKRSDAINLMSSAGSSINALLGGSSVEDGSLIAGHVRAAALQTRMDAYYYSEPCRRARHRFDTASASESRLLGTVADVFIPGIFRRRYAEDPSYGCPYLTGASVFHLAPSSDKYLMTKVVTENRLKVRSGMILVQEAGQLGGLIGRSVFVGRHLAGFAVSNNMVRIMARNQLDAGFLYALLSCPEGVTLLSREAAGSSIPHMDAARIRAIELPWPEESLRAKIAAPVLKAVQLRDEAAEDEDEARALVERAIEEAT